MSSGRTKTPLSSTPQATGLASLVPYTMAPPAMRTSQLGDSMSFKFKGPSIRLMGAQGWNHGSFIVNLDGNETIVDGYCCGSGGAVPQVIQFETNGLCSGLHTLNVTNFAAGPHGSVLEVDAL
ncbi:hypothetical protein B0H14DRAFT_3897550, partial [Mycena olivaceomarginata]